MLYGKSDKGQVNYCTEKCCINSFQQDARRTTLNPSDALCTFLSSC